MDLRHLSLIFLIIAIIWSSIYAFGDHGIVIYSSELPSVDKGFTVVYSGTRSPIYIYVYNVYLLQSFKGIESRVAVDFHINNLTYASLPIINIRIKYFVSNYTPIKPPCSLLTYLDFVSLYEGKVDPILIGMGLEDKHIVLKNIRSKYLIIIIVLSIKQDVIVDLSKYVPPITYYPSSPPQPNMFAYIVENSFNNSYYKTMLLFLAEKIYENAGVVNVYQEYVLTSQNIKLIHVLTTWIFSILFIEVYDFRFISKLFKGLTYRTVFLGSYLLKTLRKLLKYMARQHRS